MPCISSSWTILGSYLFYRVSYVFYLCIFSADKINSPDVIDSKKRTDTDPVLAMKLRVQKNITSLCRTKRIRQKLKQKPTINPRFKSWVVQNVLSKMNVIGEWIFFPTFKRKATIYSTIRTRIGICSNFNFINQTINIILLK